MVMYLFAQDYKLTVNKVIDTDHYLFLTPEDISASLCGGTIFSVIDLSGAYQQLKVHPDFQKCLAVNTHIGIFQFTKLTYGIFSTSLVSVTNGSNFKRNTQSKLLFR